MKKILFSILLFPLSLFAVDIGDSVESFELYDQNNNLVSLEKYKDNIVVLEWLNPECPFVKRHYKAKTMHKLRNKYKQDKVVWLSINSTHFHDVKTNKEWVDDEDIDWQVLSDPEGKVGKLYSAKTTPHMFVIDKSGKLAYQGAIDSDAYGEEDAVQNYVDFAIKQLLAGKELNIPETQPYGCSVKYK